MNSKFAPFDVAAYLEAVLGALGVKLAVVAGPSSA
jgi:hypothetical protein